MKMMSMLYRLGRERNVVPEPPWRSESWLNRRNRVEARVRLRSIELTLEGNSFWRITGNLRGLRIDCRKGPLWITQSGAAADVILHAGQRFVAGEGTLVLQSEPSPEAETRDSPTDGRTPESAAFGVLTTACGSAQIKVVRERGTVERTEAGVAWVRQDAAENLAFGLVGLAALIAIGYCLNTVMGLPWPH